MSDIAADADTDEHLEILSQKLTLDSKVMGEKINGWQVQVDPSTGQHRSCAVELPTNDSRNRHENVQADGDSAVCTEDQPSNNAKHRGHTGGDMSQIHAVTRHAVASEMTQPGRQQSATDDKQSDDKTGEADATLQQAFAELCGVDMNDVNPLGSIEKSSEFATAQRNYPNLNHFWIKAKNGSEELKIIDGMLYRRVPSIV